MPRRPSHLPVPRSLLLGAVALCMLAGCSGGGGGEGSAGFAGGTSPAVAAAQRAAANGEPMTVYQKKKLVARVTQDPRQLGRLSLRERRELSGMIKAEKDRQDENDR